MKRLTSIAVATLASAFAVNAVPAERRKDVLVCIAPFTAAARPNDAQLTNSHQPTAKSVFTISFGNGLAVSVRSKERKILRIRTGEYRVNISLDSKPVESFRLRIRKPGASLWYLDSSGWQVSTWPDRAHGCA